MSFSDSVKNLSARILSREVVFFIGSGFSIDSEWNTARRLMIRLVLRMRALLACLLEIAKYDNSKIHKFESILAAYPDNFRKTFDLQHTCTTNFDCKSRCWDSNVFSHCDFDKLAVEYYAANDWFCAVFQRLLAIGGELDDLDQLIKSVTDKEHVLNSTRLEKTALRPIDKQLFRWAKSIHEPISREAGKALFLDTLGFADEQVMGGSAFAQDEDLEILYRNKLMPRHYVLARLAREGFCPLAITTNYDLLLEGAWRQSGFPIDDPWSSEPVSPNTSKMARVASPHDFQTHGKAVNTSLVVKVHGCAEAYRKIRKQAIENLGDDKSDVEHFDRWRSYMRSIVFTYREIQNWRKDSWSRDFLANLQRTRTVVFAGYSLQDPVIHNSFRTVYEEMAANKPLFEKSPDSPATPPSATPAFFFGQAGKDSFHAQEMLEAATHAIGATSSEKLQHENYIPFHFRDRHVPNRGEYPNLDDLFRLTYHHVIRRYQSYCLKNHLRSVWSTLMARPLWPSEYECIEASFKRILLQESIDLNLVDQAHMRRRMFAHRVTAWTYYFHARLLREFHLCDAAQADDSHLEFDKMREGEWYFPFTARPDWTAWAVIVELAIRNMLAAVDVDAASIEPIKQPMPTIIFTRQQPCCNDSKEVQGEELLRLQAGPYNRRACKRSQNYAVGFETTWLLPGAVSPWHTSPIAENPEAGQTTNNRFVRPFGRYDVIAPGASELQEFVLRRPNASEIGRWIIADNYTESTTS